MTCGRSSPRALDVDHGDSKQAASRAWGVCRNLVQSARDPFAIRHRKKANAKSLSSCHRDSCDSPGRLQRWSVFSPTWHDRAAAAGRHVARSLSRPKSGPRDRWRPASRLPAAACRSSAQRMAMASPGSLSAIARTDFKTGKHIAVQRGFGLTFAELSFRRVTPRPLLITICAIACLLSNLLPSD